MAKTKETKREEALKRQEKYDKLSTREKLAQLDARGITKGREHDRLIEKIATGL